jgi:serine/threonine-protein kinase RsbW
MTGDTTYRLEGRASPEALHELHELLERVRREHWDLSPDDVSMIETAVMEIAGNVVEHGQPSGQVQYSFEVDIEPERLQARLSDSGEAVPASAQDREMPGEMAEEGRGLALAEAALDELRYERVQGWNRWEMVRLRRRS